MTRLQERYDSEVKPALMQEFGYKNAMQVPRLDKIVVNIGVGEAVQDAKKIDAAVNDLTAITGQHPVVIRAKQSIATFKLRKNMPIGVKVTLRRQRMYEFLDRLINVAHIDPQSGKPTRVGFKIMDDGSKVRIARRSGENIAEPRK